VACRGEFITEGDFTNPRLNSETWASHFHGDFSTFPGLKAPISRSHFPGLKAGAFTVVPLTRHHLAQETQSSVRTPGPYT
jgi:hypothetical protein